MNDYRITSRMMDNMIGPRAKNSLTERVRADLRDTLRELLRMRLVEVSSRSVLVLTDKGRSINGKPDRGFRRLSKMYDHDQRQHVIIE